MAVKVLIAGTDFDIQRLVVDLLELMYRKPVVERALSIESLHEKIARDSNHYDLIVIDNGAVKDFDGELSHIDKSRGDLIATKVILLAETAEDLAANKLEHRFVSFTAPFSLDDLAEKIAAIVPERAASFL